MKRRKFISQSLFSGSGLLLSAGILPLNSLANKTTLNMTNKVSKPFPITIATWNFPNASIMAGEMLENGATALDAVEQGVMVEEANLKNTTVGKGGAPDRDGNVTLDACIMAPTGDAGAVVYLKNNTHAVSVARKVMEETPHVMLAGEGADQFAREQGFKQENLLTPESEKAYKEWLKKKEYKPIINIENHDTIGMLCIDQNGDIAGACTSSGLSYKMNGRVGDSPIIGSGLFLDNEVGGAVATGMGEAIMKSVGSFLIVELMRQGKSPQEACEEAIKRIIARNPNYREFQAAFITLNKKGEIGSYCIQKGFSYVKYQQGKNENVESGYFMEN
ncbi:N(4)-(beta-N-acetylglucosaminyl)-L-asparaginase [Antarcticibacterium flavum]|uniref:N(4)-(Beta-N-acetylglucosaminyl)-L-asparaginase n=1 Tax=Antarcticibacterium flavum TaxID=2058175 RepID=A0A5B7X3I3_9FLAO|nr:MULTISPECIES: N(4)-(beta-N-acetylglucosaminyl)-L-asparaginase [Antarcticibacterium]MCM4161854.1 glycosylasparaginase [Antarcticibacterium sp. W02-3]QCY70036.1 N(4)-(beta-N-acetylglucosaminyl)-L-asparaginase [Antarcticibacterium flavum]